MVLASNSSVSMHKNNIKQMDKITILRTQMQAAKKFISKLYKSNIKSLDHLKQ